MTNVSLSRRAVPRFASWLCIPLVALLFQGCVLLESNENPPLEEEPPNCFSSQGCLPPQAVTCYSSSDCYSDNTICTVEIGECSAPSYCDDGYDCPDVCTGTCINVPECAENQALHCATDNFGQYVCTCTPNVDLQDPGECVPAACDEVGPACPSGTVPGVSTQTACYTGYCIPLYACDQVDCSSLHTVQDCAARFDCAPLFEGSDCDCNAAGQCTCENVWFDRCESTIATAFRPI